MSKTKESRIVETHFLVPNKKKRIKKFAVKMEYSAGRIFFLKSAFALKDEIKNMQGSKWLGYDDPNPRKIWSVKDCPRNHFQIKYLQGGNPYAHWDQQVTKHEYDHELPFYPHQNGMCDHVLTYRHVLLSCVMRAGKNRVVIEAMQRTGYNHFYFVAPKQVLPAIALEFDKWGLDPTIKVELMTYDKLAMVMDTAGKKDFRCPRGVIFDEASLVKNASTRRGNGAMKLANMIREQYGFDSLIVPMTGTPSSKSPCDIWHLTEIACPGWLAEGSAKQLEQRLGIFEEPKASAFGNHFKKRVGWKNQDGCCQTCGQLENHPNHTFDPDEPMAETHTYKAGVNEVELLHKRLEGLTYFVNESDLNLGPRNYIREYCKVPKKLLRIAKALKDTARSTITGLNSLRQLSDGFAYNDVADGTRQCEVCGGEGEVETHVNADGETFDDVAMLKPSFVRNLRKEKRDCLGCGGSGNVPKMKQDSYRITCEKDDLLIKWLGVAEERDDRVCVFAGFRDSVNRCAEICRENGWVTIQIDGNGVKVRDVEGKVVPTDNHLKYWSDMTNKKVAVVANAASAGFGLTLTEASVLVYYSNSYRTELRRQSEARNWLPGSDKEMTIVDLINLPSDERALDVIQADISLEKIVLGDLLGDCFEVSNA